MAADLIVPGLYVVGTIVLLSSGLAKLAGLLSQSYAEDNLILGVTILHAVILVPRRAWPREVFLASLGLGLLSLIAGLPLGVQTVVMVLIVLYATTRSTSRGFGLLALLITLAALVIFFLVPANFDLAAYSVPIGIAIALVILVWSIADQERAAHERRQIKEQAERAREGEAAAGRVAGDVIERQRIARDMHDIVAHGLSVMIVQADGGRYAASSDPLAATRALETIAATGRSSLAEMRRLLGVLRDGETGLAPSAPQPGVADIPSLVTSLNSADRPVHFAHEGEASAAISPAVGLAAYRVVQESLTNVLKHAGPGASAWVHVSCSPDALIVEVVDDGGGSRDASTQPIRASQSPGFGLRGMQERVGLAGGSLLAGPAPRGGFRVVATFPLHAPNPDSPNTDSPGVDS